MTSPRWKLSHLCFHQWRRAADRTPSPRLGPLTSIQNNQGHTFSFLLCPPLAYFLFLSSLLPVLSVLCSSPMPTLFNSAWLCTRVNVQTCACAYVNAWRRTWSRCLDSEGPSWGVMCLMLGQMPVSSVAWIWRKEKLKHLCLSLCGVKASLYFCLESVLCVWCRYSSLKCTSLEMELYVWVKQTTTTTTGPLENKSRPCLKLKTLCWLCRNCSLLV